MIFLFQLYSNTLLMDIHVEKGILNYLKELSENREVDPRNRRGYDEKEEEDEFKLAAMQ